MILEHVLFVAMLVVFPVWDYFEMRRLKTTTNRRAKVHFFWRIMAVQWIVVGLLLWTRGRQQLFHLENPETVPVWMTPALLAGLVALGLAIYRLGPAASARLTRWGANFSLLLPRTRNERRLFEAGCLTAGICEGIIYHGFLIQYLVELPIGLSFTTALLLSSLLYGLAHLGEGPVGMVRSGLFGGLLGLMFLAPGILFFSILIHTSVNSSALKIPAPRGTEPPTDSLPLTR